MGRKRVFERTMPSSTLASTMCWPQSRFCWSIIVSQKLNSTYEKARSLRGLRPVFRTVSTHTSHGAALLGRGGRDEVEQARRDPGEGPD